MKTKLIVKNIVTMMIIQIDVLKEVKHNSI